MPPSPWHSSKVSTTLDLETSEQTFTLLGVRADGVASVVDLVAAEDITFAHARARALLREHGSCTTVEVWRGGAIVAELTR